MVLIRRNDVGVYMIAHCVFCEIQKNEPALRIIAQNKFAIAMSDGFPLTNGHTLLIPKRHIQSFFDITEKERTAIFTLLDIAKKRLDQEYSPDAYNIGINDGEPAGQTVPHLHIHLVPRYKGDVEDPRGGIRWIMPDKADYWSKKSD